MTQAAICTTLPSMDEKTIRRAALITLHRAICERFPAGRELSQILTRKKKAPEGASCDRS
jgi:hypothetical protein